MTMPPHFLELDLRLAHLTANSDAWGHLLAKLGAETGLPGRGLGLIDRFDHLRSRGFDPARVHALIRRFYVETESMRMQTVMHWRLPVLGPLYAKAATIFGQLSPPTEDVRYWTPMVSTIADVPELGGPLGARLWRRRIGPRKEAFYTAVVRPYLADDKTYLQVAVLYWFGHISVVFELKNPRDASGNITSGFIGDARTPGREDAPSDRGVWLVRRFNGAMKAMRAPLARGERITLDLVRGGGEGGFVGHHESFVNALGERKFLEMRYQIFPPQSPPSGSPSVPGSD